MTPVRAVPVVPLRGRFSYPIRFALRYDIPTDVDTVGSGVVHEPMREARCRFVGILGDLFRASSRAKLGALDSHSDGFAFAPYDLSMHDELQIANAVQSGRPKDIQDDFFA